jgi:arylsulfatase A-like enzyme
VIFALSIALSIAPPAHAQPERGPNIVVISIDGMRADRAGYEGYGLPTTPNLDAFAAGGVRFPNSWSEANESLLSHAALLSGRYASEIASPDYLTYLIPEEELLLSEAMQAVGYQTAAFIGGGHIRESFGFNQGYDRYFESGEDFGSLYESTREALEWLEGLEDKRPFYLFLHGYDLHRPYFHGSVFAHPLGPGARPGLEEMLAQRNTTEHIYRGVLYADFPVTRVWHSNGEKMLNPGDYPRLATFAEEAEHDPEMLYVLSEDELAHIDRHYDAAVLIGDTYVGLFLEGLQQQGLWEDTIVIVTSDHGEDMQDHGYYNHRTLIYDSTTRVPFLVGGGALPPEARGTVRGDLVSAVDLVPTVMDLAGSVAPAAARGRSLAPALRGEEPEPVSVTFQEGVLGQLGARTERWRLNFHAGLLTDPASLETLVTAPIDGGAFQLYDTFLDPDEQEDVLSAHAEVAEALRAALVRWRRDLAVGTASRPLTPEQQRMLQEHGYW